MTTDYQTEKALVRDLYDQIEAAGAVNVAAALSKALSSDCLWRGFHPFHEQTGPASIARAFWVPLMQSLKHLQRRQDVFFAGRNQIDDFASVWVVSMGHLMGLFDQDWLGIRATGKIAMLRYCEFSRVAHGKITEQAMFFDIPHFMAQAGQDPFGPQTGQFLVQPGPRTHDGLLWGAHDPAEATATLDAINAMVADISDWAMPMTLEEELARTWHDDMLWWGPHGIGASYTIERYAKQHSGPFRAAFKERQFNGHVAKLAEGNYGGFFGWPNLTLRNKGGFMGMPATGRDGDMRVIDIYRRDGDKLAENWIFIDILHFWAMQGVDLLERATSIGKH